jgi:hypothetical protein
VFPARQGTEFFENAHVPVGMVVANTGLAGDAWLPVTRKCLHVPSQRIGEQPEYWIVANGSP